MRDKLSTKLFAEIAQLVEHNLAKVGVASSSLVFRSKKSAEMLTYFLKRGQDLNRSEMTERKYHPTGFNHMSVVLVHKAGFFVLFI